LDKAAVSKTVRCRFDSYHLTPIFIKEYTMPLEALSKTLKDAYPNHIIGISRWKDGSSSIDFMVAAYVAIYIYPSQKYKDLYDVYYEPDTRNLRYERVGESLDADQVIALIEEIKNI
jgi:hypothetical protein